MLIIAIFVGAVLAYAMDEVFPGVAGALLAWLAVRSFRQQRRIDELSELLASASAPATDAAMAPAGSAPTPPAVTGAAGAEEGALAGAPWVDVAPAEPADSPGLAASRSSTASAAAAPRLSAAGASVDASSAGTDPLWSDAAESDPVPTRGGAETGDSPAWLGRAKAWLFGGNTIVKAGVGILFVGLAFLAKYASEHVSVPVEIRLAGIAAVALVLLGIGWRLRQRRAAYAQVLQGGAVAVLYLTLFVAFRFYGVLAAGPVFAMMVVVAGLAAALAVLQDAKALALIGAIGGYVTPLLISTGAGNHVALFSYYGVLNLGVAAVAWFKDWRALNLVGFFATFLVGSVWGVLQYKASHYASSQAFLIANFLLFNAILLMPARRAAVDTSTGTPRSAAWVNGSLLFGLPTIVFVLQHGLVRHTEYGTAISALVLAGFYVLLARLMRSRPALAVSFEASLAIAVIFLTLVIPFALDARSTAGAWALEGAGLVWLGCRQRRGPQRIFGYALFMLAGVAMAWALQQGAPVKVLNATLFNALMAAAASLAAAFFVHRAELGLDAEAGAGARLESGAEPVLIGLGVLWLLAVSALQIDTFVDARHVLAAWLGCVSAIVLLCTALAVRLDWDRVALPAIAHGFVLALGALFSAALLLEPADHGGAWAWPVALTTHLVVLRWAAPRWPVSARPVVNALGTLVLAVLAALQGRAITAGWGDPVSAWAWLGWLVGPALLLALLLRPTLAERWPVSAAPSAYRSGAAAVLCVGLLLWTLLANLDSTGSALPLLYLPMLNPLDLGVGLALVAAWAWMRGDAGRGLLAGRERLGIAALGGCGFVWLNAMLIRAFHHFGGVPFHFDAWSDSLPVQTGLTLLWTVTALVLMWLSARRTMRAPWLVGAALLGAVVLKLLLVDLSGSGTVTRIVSFIGVGVLMLVIGYVAPLPAKEDHRAAT